MSMWLHFQFCFENYYVGRGYLQHFFEFKDFVVRLCDLFEQGRKGICWPNVYRSAALLSPHIGLLFGISITAPTSIAIFAAAPRLDFEFRIQLDCGYKAEEFSVRISFRLKRTCTIRDT